MPTEVAERQWLINVAGVPGPFQTKTGGGVSVEHTKDFPGGSLTPTIGQGPPQYADLTVGRGYEVPRDQDVAKSLRAMLASGRRFETVVTAVPLDEALVPAGAAETFDVVLRDVNSPDSNANSSQRSRLELIFTVKAAR